MGESSVAVIADSTSYLPRGWADELGVRIVPVQVIVAGRPYDETEDAQAEAVTAALRDMQPVTTSRPSPARFLEAFAQAQQAGARAIVVATLSSSMSATHESALLAAREASVPVVVVDTRSIAMGEGFAVVAGARAARAGASAEEVAEVVRRTAAASHVFFYVDTLEYLRRGGRVSSAKAAMGKALQVKPLLTVTDGHVEKLEQVRTSAKALARLVDLAVDAAVEDPSVTIAVQHLAAPERADRLVADLVARLPEADVIQAPVGGVVGAHVGPGMVAVVVSPRPAADAATEPHESMDPGHG